MEYIQSKEMQKCAGEYAIFLALSNLLGLPDHITNLELTFSAYSYPLVTCTYELQEGDLPAIVNGKIVTETKKYKIIPDKDNFIGGIVAILSEHTSYTEFKININGNDEDIVVSSKSYLGDYPYKEKIKRLKEMKTKFNIRLEESK